MGFVWWIAAFRLARPESWWARRLYGPKKVEGLVNWRTDSHGGLSVIPRAIREATDEYQKQMDPLGEQIEDCCELDAHAFAAFGALRKSYDAHCKQNGRAALGAFRFNEALTEMGVPAMKQKQMIGGKQQRAR